MKRTTPMILLLAVVALIATACAKPASTTQPATQVALGNGVVAIVAGEAVTEQEFTAWLKIHELNNAQDLSDAQSKAAYLAPYVNQKLLVSEANKRGLKNQADDLDRQMRGFNAVLANKYGNAQELANQKKTRGVSDDEIKRALDASLLIDQLGNQLVSGVKISDDEIKAYYDGNVATQFTIKDEQVHVRHILVKDEAVAKDIAAKLKAGGDFAQLASTYSIDTGSAVQGGDVGFFGKGQMVQPFEDAAYALKNINDISEPVKTTFGYHIIQLLGRRSPGTMPLTEVKDQIAAQLKQDKTTGELDKLVKDLKAKANVQMVDFTKR